MTKTKSNKWYLVGFSLLFLAIFIFSFNIGKYPISPKELFHVLFSKLTGAPKDWSNQVELVIFKIRMPRAIAGSLIGAGLSAAGAAFQGLFRNPMVSPDVLGASAGAGFGAALSLFLSLGYVAVSINAFLFGILAVAVAYLISTRAKQNPMVGMVLAGMMISSLFSSATSAIKLLADPNNVLPAITYWLMGSLSSIRTQDIIYAGIPMGIGMITLFAFRWQLNLLTMGEDEARSMGVNTKIMRIIIVAAATLTTTACVSISGMIGWVGLIIPHFARMVVGFDYRVMLPTSMLMGASFLVLVDTIARSLATIEIPIGILTAFVGAPFFLYLILDKGNRI